MPCFRSIGRFPDILMGESEGVRCKGERGSAKEQRVEGDRGREKEGRRAEGE